MKKLSLVLLIIFSIISCKNPETTPKPDEKSAEAEKKATTTLNVYEGEGKYNKDGKARYTISIPADLHDEVRNNVKYHRVDDYIIIELNIATNNVLSNPNNDMLTLEFDIPDFNNDTIEFKAMSWHDSEPLNNDDDCRVAIALCDSSEKANLEALTPKSCGLGTIRP